MVGGVGFNFIVDGEIVFQLVKKALAFGRHILLFQVGQLAKQSLLFFADFFGYFDHYLDKEVA